MPRGIYDRSTLKKPIAAPEPAAAPEAPAAPKPPPLFTQDDVDQLRGMARLHLDPGPFQARVHRIADKIVIALAAQGAQ